MKLFAVIAFALVLASPVSAQEMRTLQMFCGPSAFLVEKIKERKQAPVGFGSINGGRVGMNIWRDAEGTKWTITIMNPMTKTMCVIADGTDYQSLLWHLEPSGSKT